MGGPHFLFVAALAALVVMSVSSSSSSTQDNEIKCSAGATVLDLSGSNLSKVDFHSSCNSVEELDLSYNSLETIDEDMFHNVPAVTFLNLASSGVTELHKGAFAELSNLKYLDLQCNPIPPITADLFGSTSALVFVNLLGTQISQIPIFLFNKFPQMKVNMTCYQTPQYFQILANKNVSDKISFSPPLAAGCSLPPGAPLPPATCPSSSDDNSSSDSALSGDLIAVCVVSGACATIAICLSVCIWRRTRLSRHVKSLQLTNKPSNGSMSQEVRISEYESAAIGMPVFTEEAEKDLATVRIDNDPLQNLK